MVYRPWQRDSAIKGHACGSEWRAMCGRPRAGAARWENQSLHGVGRGGWPPRLEGPGGLLLKKSQGATYLDAVLHLRVRGLLGGLGTPSLHVPNVQSCGESSRQRSQSAWSGSRY